MASSLAVSMAIPLPLLAKAATPNRISGPINADCFFFKPFPLRLSSNSKARFEIKASSSSSSLKEKALTGLTASAVSVMIPLFAAEVASAAESASASGVSPSLKNFLLSILAGGVVLSAILGAIIAVSNFDPVKRT